MYENLAWNNFVKTGDIESFLEYRKLIEMTNYLQKQKENKLNEANQDQRNCY